MKKLGLVGGTGPESTVIYYQDINRMIYEKTKGKEFPELSIESLNLNKALGYCKEQQYQELTNYILNAITNLANGGAQYAALTANTMHIVYDSVKEQSPIPLISIIDSVCEEAKQRGYKKVGLLGTIFTMTGLFFKEPFIQQNIEIITPSKEVMNSVNNIIANELELGIVKEASTKYLIDVINTLKQDEEIEAIILGCTELPLALNDENSPVPCLDTMKIHINQLVDLMFRE